MNLHLNIKTNLKVAVFALGFVLLIAGLSAQTTMLVGDYTCCSNSEVLIPVEFRNFEAIAAFTIFIKVPNSSIELLGFENLHENVAEGSFVGSDEILNGNITFNWAYMSGMTADSGKLCDIRVRLTGENEDFIFLDMCEIARTDLSIINDVTYIDGTLTGFSYLDPIPVSQSAVENSTAHIELPGLSSDASCTWQISTKEGWVDLEENSSYKGVNTPQLKIVGVKTSMDGDLYRGLIANTICEEGTNTSELFVTTSTIDDLYSKSSYMNVFPNPSDEFINCTFNESIQKGNLIITNLNGNLVKRIDLENIVSGQKLSVNTENIASGIYILRLFSGNNLLENSKVIVQ